MSFILDALKKSEKERQREGVPGIADMPIVVHQTRTSTWMIAVVAALSLSFVALVWVWWRTLDSAPVISTTATVTTAAVEPTTPPREPAIIAPRPPMPRPAAGTSTRSLASEAASTAAVASRSAAPPPPAVEPLVVQPASAVITPSPMSILEARASGFAVPELRLELLVYSPEPSQRFVFINASKYVEGEALAEGPRLVEISPEGAILSYSGQNFLLPQE